MTQKKHTPQTPAEHAERDFHKHIAGLVTKRQQGRIMEGFRQALRTHFDARFQHNEPASDETA